MVSALYSGSSGPGSWPGTLRCSAPLNPGVYILWVPANLLLGVALRWTSIPSRGE